MEKLNLREYRDVIIIIFGVFIFYQLVGIALGTSHPIDVVVSNSMKPNMNPGDLVICAKDTPKLNDVVIYTARIKDKNYPIIHRIIGINDTYCKKKIKNGTCYVIKGDNNPVADPPVSENQIVCVSKLRIPYIAYPRYIIYKILGI